MRDYITLPVELDEITSFEPGDTVQPHIVIEDRTVSLGDYVVVEMEADEKGALVTLREKSSYLEDNIRGGESDGD